MFTKRFLGENKEGMRLIQNAIGVTDKIRYTLGVPLVNTKAKERREELFSIEGAKADSISQLEY